MLSRRVLSAASLARGPARRSSGKEIMRTTRPLAALAAAALVAGAVAAPAGAFSPYDQQPERFLEQLESAKSARL